MNGLFVQIIKCKDFGKWASSDKEVDIIGNSQYTGTVNVVYLHLLWQWNKMYNENMINDNIIYLLATCACVSFYFLP